MPAEVVLVIDDEPQIRRVVRHALERDVARVIEAADGRAGIDAAAAERPTLIVLDLGLPDMSGIDVCREISSASSSNASARASTGSPPHLDSWRRRMCPKSCDVAASTA